MLSLNTALVRQTEISYWSLTHKVLIVARAYSGIELMASSLDTIAYTDACALYRGSSNLLDSCRIFCRVSVFPLIPFQSYIFFQLKWFDPTASTATVSTQS